MPWPCPPRSPMQSENDAEISWRKRDQEKRTSLGGKSWKKLKKSWNIWLVKSWKIMEIMEKSGVNTKKNDRTVEIYHDSWDFEPWSLRGGTPDEYNESLVGGEAITRYDMPQFGSSSPCSRIEQYIYIYAYTQYMKLPVIRTCHYKGDTPICGKRNVGMISYQLWSPAESSRKSKRQSGAGGEWLGLYIQHISDVWRQLVWECSIGFCHCSR